MEKGNTDLSNLIRSTKSMSVHMIMYYWSEMLTTVNEVHSYGKLFCRSTLMFIYMVKTKYSPCFSRI